MAPATIDLRFIRFLTSVLLPDGSELVLTPFILGRTREESDSAFGELLKLKLRDAPAGRLGDLSTLVVPGTRLVQVVSYDEGRSWDDTWRYEGEVLDWTPRDQDYTFTVAAYDPLQALMTDKADIHAFYPSGKPGSEILADVFARFGLPVGRLDGPTAPMPKILFGGKAGELVLAVLQHALAVGDKCFVPRWHATDRHVDVTVPGGNDPIYVYDATSNVVGMDESRSSQQTVSELEVIGSQQEQSGDPAPRPVVAVAAETVPDDDETVVGVRPRKIVRAATAETADAARSMAETGVERDSLPAVWRSARLYDAPPLGKGAVIRLKAGRVDAYQVIGAISHDEDALVAECQVAARGTPLYQAQRFEDRKAALAGKSAGGKGLSGLFAWCRAHLGIPYVWGGKSAGGYDCSGFTAAAFQEALGVDIGAGTSGQWDKNPEGDGAPGDLVFFSHTAMVDGVWADHVGICGPDTGMMFHAGNPSQYAPISSIKVPKGFRRPVDFSALKASGSAVAGGGKLSIAPADLAGAIQRYFPRAAWDDAAAVSYCETGGWTTFHNTTYPDDSHGYFQINIYAHGQTAAYWMVTENNVRKAAELWRAAGGSFARDWVNCSRRLGLT